MTAPCFLLYYFQRKPQQWSLVGKYGLHCHPERWGTVYIHLSRTFPHHVMKHHVYGVLAMSQAASTYGIFAFCLLVWAMFPLMIINAKESTFHRSCCVYVLIEFFLVFPPRNLLKSSKSFGYKLCLGLWRSIPTFAGIFLSLRALVIFETQMG